ncbi:uncharacterized protein LOC131042706 isoform X4 [Cryptomeria japonica]|uniref:uncharacterized protein LOC131042706 isoform X4 n=1 Tax=Cryptomeria japonica TaxID=3369 RepID=UPI0027DA2F5B|nr:uncharacterized protein LOC131042706 isoform X4 [Cryptomeria japonica]
MTWQSAAHAKFSVFLISLRTFTHLQCDSRVDFSSDLETVEKITELKMEAKMWLVVVYCLVGISQSIVLGSPNLAVAPLSRIAFGSCANQSAPQPIWDAISRFNPHLFIWLGDNIYADEKLAAKIIGKERTVGPWKNTQRFLPVSDKEMKFKYDQAKTNPGYAWLRSKTQVIGTWDDHDYGLNDAGKEYPNKAISQKLMLDFLDEASNSPRRKQAGVYASYLFGPVGKQIKVILLDTRYHRDSLFSNGEMLGETQWTWLEKELKGNGAQITIIASSIQASNDDPQSRRINYLADSHQRRSSQDKDDLLQSSIIKVDLLQSSFIKDDLLHLSSSPAFEGKHHQMEHQPSVRQGGIPVITPPVGLVHLSMFRFNVPDSLKMAQTSMYLPRLSIGRIFQRRHVSK